jgi:transcriptional regulator with XRE-family HTH domain
MKTQQEINQISTMIRQARSAQHMTQLQLAEKCGIAKSRISQVENDIGNVPVYILRTIVERGLGGQFRIAFEF